MRGEGRRGEKWGGRNGCVEVVGWSEGEGEGSCEGTWSLFRQIDRLGWEIKIPAS